MQDIYICLGHQFGRADVRACMQATRQIRAMGVATPIVAVSSDSLPPDVQAFITAGANDFTPKVTN
jgi:CheY-like chemotaxis protein